MTPTDNPYRALELTQLIDDLSRTGLAVLHKRDGLAIVAEALYERGVRSRLFAPYRDSELVQFTWDPDIEGFEITETGVFELVMEAVDVPAIEPFPTFPRAEMPRMLHRLRRKAGLRPVLAQMSEVPGHVDVAPKPFTCVSCGRGFTALEDGRIQFHKARLGTEWSECQGSRKPPMAPEMAHLFGAPRTVPGPVPERQLPEAVYRVIRLAQYLRSSSLEPDSPILHYVTPGGESLTLTIPDLEATLAEIPDVAPRYPTIWAYEQACRTIRERDRRIEDALTVLEQRPPDPEDCIKVIRDAHETLKLRMPRTEPATPKQLSEVARALELVEEASPDVSLESWAAAATTLRDEVQRMQDVVGEAHQDLLGVVLTDSTGEVIPCGTCSALEPPVVTPAVGRSGRGWPRCAPHLVEDALDDAGLEKTVKRCSSCSHLASAHYEDGSGCGVTIRDVTMGKDNHCPCSFDARTEAWGGNNA